MIFDKEKIKAVIFDWGGVCCREAEPFASLDLQSTLSMSPEQIAEKAREIYNGYYIGKYNSETFWRAIMSRFGLRRSKKINPLVLSNAYLNSYEIYPEVFEVVKKLKSKYRVVLLSNLTPEMCEHIRAKHELAKYFNVEVYSCDLPVAAMKPEFKPYQVILEKLRLSAKNCLFIDNSEKNIKTAEALGFQTILFKDALQFLKEIKILL